jgi:hypothetical protein
MLRHPDSVLLMDESYKIATTIDIRGLVPWLKEDGYCSQNKISESSLHL